MEQIDRAESQLNALEPVQDPMRSISQIEINYKQPDLLSQDFE